MPIAATARPTRLSHEFAVVGSKPRISAIGATNPAISARTKIHPAHHSTDPAAERNPSARIPLSPVDRLC